MSISVHDGAVIHVNGYTCVPTWPDARMIVTGTDGELLTLVFRAHLAANLPQAWLAARSDAEDKMANQI